jgi:hypothetical protein
MFPVKKKTKMGGQFSVDTPEGLICTIPLELAHNIFRLVENPVCLTRVCKTYYSDNYLWWLVFEQQNKNRAYR